MSVQECLARRKDCSGEGRVLEFSRIKEICNSATQAATKKPFFIVLPDGIDYKGGIYSYNSEGLVLLSEKEKTKFTLELYPELIIKETIKYEDLIQVGIIWQYLSLNPRLHPLHL